MLPRRCPICASLPQTSRHHQSFTCNPRRVRRSEENRRRGNIVGLADSVTADTRIGAVQRCLTQLDLTVDRSDLTADDQETARQEDRQGLGLSRPQRTSP